MPTKYKPQLDHQSYRWDDQLEKDLRLILNEIVEAVGLKQKRIEREPGEPFDYEEEDGLLRQLVAALSLAAAIRIDADTLATNKLVATIRAIEKEPSLIWNPTIEPEALAVLARHYRRENEPLGTYWMDVHEPDFKGEIKLAQVKQAATLAIGSLRNETKRGRPNDEALAELGANLREVYLQYNPTARRVSTYTSRNGKTVQTEAGQFLRFVELVVAPLNKYLAAQPTKPRPFPAAQVVRKAKYARPGRSKYVRPSGDRN
jgi:hypothetical protein